MFSTALKFASECLRKWFNVKCKNENLQLSNDVKRKYEIEHPINWEIDRCCICAFPLESIRQCQLRQKTLCLVQISSFIKNINF